MANRSSDFNYKVALASGLKSLQSGRLRSAEEQFRYLMKHFPSAEGGYRGLAKVLVEQEDRASAVRILLDGGAALAKAEQRTLATQLYREAVTLDPNDLAAHRRLAAALALAGQTDDAAHEYVRFIQNAMSHGDEPRAKLEAAYAIERLPGNGEVEEVATRLHVAIPPPPQPRKIAMPEMMGEVLTPVAPPDVKPARQPRATTGPERPSDPVTPPPPAPAPDPSMWNLPEPARETWNAPTQPAKDAWAEVAAPSDVTDKAAPNGEHAPEPQPMPEDADAQTVEATAAQYMANGDQRAGQAALEAARRYLADGRIDAASDLLLHLIASDVERHDAQRLLVEVTKSMGKDELTKTKMRLLVEALRLDGRADLAAEVEQAAQAE